MPQTIDGLTANTELIVGPSAPVYLGGKNRESVLVNSVSIALAASVTTDGMDITLTCLGADGVRVAGVHILEVWISESAAGAGLTADAYSGAVTAVTGAILTALTAKKHFSVVTTADGIATMLAVASANPTDQYVCVKNPVTGRLHISAASGTNWEGAA